MMWIYAIICLWIYWKKINDQREGVALIALAGAVGALTWELLMLWKEIAPFFGGGFF